MSDIDVAFNAGQLVCVVGANGSGKSTLAKLLNGLLLPTTGTVFIKGRPTHDAAALWDIRREIGVVFQNPDNQFVGATVEDDIAFGPQNFGFASDVIDKSIDEALHSVGIFHLKDKPPHLLSGGQKQLVAIAGVLAQRPTCVVLDEATSMLDPQARTVLMNIVLRLVKERGVTVLHITHHMDETFAADRIIALAGGQIAFDGPPVQLLTDERLIETLGLEMPPVLRLSRRLARLGLLSEDAVITDVQELVERICRSS